MESTSQEYIDNHDACFKTSRAELGRESFDDDGGNDSAYAKNSYILREKLASLPEELELGGDSDVEGLCGGRPSNRDLDPGSADHERKCVDLGAFVTASDGANFDSVLGLVGAKVAEVMKQVRGSWPSWPPPAEVTVNAV